MKSAFKSFFIPEMAPKPDIGTDFVQNLKYQARWVPLMLLFAAGLAVVVKLCGGF